MTADLHDVHPDDGTIHAWLEDALDAVAAARIESHVGTCAECASRVAEARGLIAGASRVMGLLDAHPAPLIRPAVAVPRQDDGSLWRMLRVTPMRAGIAAMLLVATGIMLTRDRAADELLIGGRLPDTAALASASAERMSGPPIADATTGGTAASAESARDTILQSAVARKIAAEHPQRTVEPVPGAAPARPLAQADEVTSSKRLHAGAEAAAVMAAGSASAAAGLRRAPAATAGSCYRIEGADGAVNWGGIALPVEVALSDSVISAPTERVQRSAITDRSGRIMRGNWSVGVADSILILLRDGAGVTTGTIEGGGDARGGVLVAGERDRPAGVTSQESRVGAPRTVRVVARAVPCGR